MLPLIVHVKETERKKNSKRRHYIRVSKKKLKVKYSHSKNPEFKIELFTFCVREMSNEEIGENENLFIYIWIWPRLLKK